MDIHEQNTRLIEMYEAAVAVNPNDDSELVSLVQMDMACKNGGLACWADWGIRGLESIKAFARDQGFEELSRICDFVEGKSTDEIASSAEQGAMTIEYYRIMDQVTQVLFAKYVADEDGALGRDA